MDRVVNMLPATRYFDTHALPRRVALTYLLLGAVWMAVTDQAITRLIPDGILRNEYRMINDWVFVFFSALLLYRLLGSATNAILKSEERYRMLVEHLPDSVFTYGNGRVTYTNPMGAHLLHQRSSEEIIGKSWEALLAPECYRAFQGQLSDVGLSSRASTFNESTITLPDGTSVPIEMVVIPFKQNDEEFLQIVIHNTSRRKRFEEALHRSEASYRELFADNPLPMLVFDRQTLKITAANTAALQHYGYTNDAMLSMSLDMLNVRHARSSIRAVLSSDSKLLRTEYSAQHRKADKTVIDVDITLRALSSSGSKALLALINDVTESKRLQAEQATFYRTLERRIEDRTREIEQRRRVAEGLRDILSALNSSRPLEEILDLIAGQASEMLGNQADAIYRLEDSSGKLHLQTARGMEDAINHEVEIGYGALGFAVLTREPVAIDNLVLAMIDASQPLKTRNYLRQLAKSFKAVLSLPIIIRDEVYGGINLYYAQEQEFSSEQIDLARSFSNQIALAIENGQLRAAVAEQASTAERTRLAHDLHDAVAQTLFSAALIAEVLPSVWHIDQAEGQKRLVELHELTKGALAEMRTLLLTLRPSALTEMSLPEAIQQLVDAGVGRMRLPISYDVEGPCKLPMDAQVAFYRITQEALNNIYKHAGATRVTVRLEGKSDQVTLDIVDNGCGFDTTLQSPGHLGLGIMEERAQAVGVHLQIESVPGNGTHLAAHWRNVEMEKVSKV